MRLVQDEPSFDQEKLIHMQLGLGAALKSIGEYHDAGEVLWKALEGLLEWSARGDDAALLSLVVEGFATLAEVELGEGAHDEAMRHLQAGFQALGTNGAQEHPRLWRALTDRTALVYSRK